ncbi:MAG: hypothetical protein ACE37K_09425 [Planctomycetota bacterium]
MPRILFVSFALAGALAAQNTVQVPLHYNFNGIAHSGEAGSPDAPNGFRSISDRALDFTNGVPASAVLQRFALVETAGVLDMVHLGNRDTVDNGNWAFDSFANGNDVGVQPSWLGNPDQAGPQTTAIATPIPLGATSTASVLFHVSNGGGSCDVTFGYQSGASSTHVVTAPDWFGGSIPGRDSVDRANSGSNLNLVEFVIDLSGQAGEAMTSVTFANRSNQNAGYGFYGVNVEAAVLPERVNAIALDYNWNGMVHAGEAQQPDAPNGFRAVADRALDFQGGVPSNALLDGFELVDQPGVLDLVMIGNRDTLAGGSLAFDPTPDGDDLGVQPAWLPNVDLTGPQTTTLAAPILLDGASEAEFLFQMTHGGGAFDVTFSLQGGSITATLRGGDWVGGSFAGTGNADRALPGLPLRIERGTVDLSPLQGFVLTGITFSNFSNQSGACAVLAANVTGCLACANAGGAVVLGGGVGPTISTTSNGALGCDLDWTVAGATPNTPFGLWALSVGQTSLPLSTVFPACSGTVHVLSPVLLPALVDGAGGATFTLPMPGTPGLCGQVVVGQYVELSAAACGFVLGDALAFTIGN